ncbi:MAG: hypothetical protein VX519_06980 [Myxococcota bacterium]|nr:hypothetical protein [Myxococcota bacterium]
MDKAADQEVVGHRPIPANNPVWEALDDSFHRAPEFYGERSWDDVIMRVMGHYEHAARDLASNRAGQGDLAGAAEAYRRLAQWLEGITLEHSETAQAMRQVYVQAARRDASLCEQLVGGGVLVPPAGMGPVSNLRWAILQSAGQGQNARALKEAERLMESSPWKGVDISSFRDFEARHALRLELVKHALDSADPLSLDPVWGYWTPEQGDRQVRILHKAAGLSQGTPAQLRALARAEPPAGGAGFTVDDLGRLPTGDSYVDVGGEPGPMAIGVLERMDRNDPAHRERLVAWVTQLNQVLLDSPSSVPSAIEGIVKELDRAGHGSRYYNIKQARNSGVRQLAKGQHWQEALEVLASNWPLHAQDFECPNRDGILLGLQGRLMLLSGDVAGMDKLGGAMAAAEDWMARIEQGRSPMPKQPPR